MLEQELFDKAIEKISKAKKILMLGHNNPRPDGDSLGSVLALALYFQSIKKDFTAFSLYQPSESLKFLPQLSIVEHDPEKIDIVSYDLIIILDFSEIKNSGLEEKLSLAKKSGLFFLRLDHHPGKCEVANIDISVTSASSTSEIIYYFLIKLGVDINKDMATCLLSGILTDTQFYTNAATSFTAIKIGSDLVRRGGHLQEVTANVWRNKALPILRLWGKVLLRLKEDPKTGIATTVIRLADLEEENLSPSATDDVANFLNILGGSRAVMILREEKDGQVKGSLRTTQDDFDVSAIAKKFGGGGHKKSSGFSIPGHIIETEEGWKVVE